MARVILKPTKYVNKVVSKAANPEIRNKAEEIGSKAESNLGAHKATGNTRIEVDHGRIDSVVALVSDDPRYRGANPAMSIEFGHHDAKTKQWVEGTHALYYAAGIL